MTETLEGPGAPRAGRLSWLPALRRAGSRTRTWSARSRRRASVYTLCSTPKLAPAIAQDRVRVTGRRARGGVPRYTPCVQYQNWLLQSRRIAYAYLVGALAAACPPNTPGFATQPHVRPLLRLVRHAKRPQVAAAWALAHLSPHPDALADLARVRAPLTLACSLCRARETLPAACCRLGAPRPAPGRARRPGAGARPAHPCMYSAPDLGHADPLG